MVCGICNSADHNRRTCPFNVDKDGRKVQAKVARKRKKKVKKNPILDISNIVYVIFDLETNGLSRHYNDIIEISATVTDETGAPTGVPFYSKCRPVAPVGYSQSIHGISDAMLKNEKLFDIVGKNFMEWIQMKTKVDEKVCMVAYNGSKFDLPFLYTCCDRYSVPISSRIFFKLDPLQIVNNITLHPIPQNKK